MSDQTVQQLQERRLLDTPFVTVYDDDVIFPGERRGRHVRIVESRPGVAVLAECAGRFALVRTYRYAIGAWEWGIPRGYGNNPDPRGTAEVELSEEVGATPDRLTLLGAIHPNSGLLAASVHLVHALYLRDVVARAATETVNPVRWVPTAGLAAEIRSGHVTDGFTLAALGVAVVQGIVRF